MFGDSAFHDAGESTTMPLNGRLSMQSRFSTMNCERAQTDDMKAMIGGRSGVAGMSIGLSFAAGLNFDRVHRLPGASFRSYMSH